MAKGQKIGFIGVGNMGWPMAANLVKAQAEVTVLDADAARAKKFADEHGCAATESLAELGAGSDIVITMLPTGAIVRNVMLESDGGALVNSLEAGKIVIDMSSSEPEGTVALGAALKEKGITLIDAPVSGGVPGAEKGTLAIMIGTDDAAAADKVEPVLEAMGGRLFRTGGLGSGHAVKSLNNIIAATTYTVVAEAVLVGRKFGLDPATVLEVVNASTGRSFTSEMGFKEHVLTRKFGAGFTLGLLAKDVGIAADLGQSIGVDAPLFSLVNEMWASAAKELGANADFTATIKAWEKANDMEID